MNPERVFQVLEGPHVSEKAAIVADESNQYVFKVHPEANKQEIKQAVQSLFKVDVTNVRTMNRRGKTKRERRPNQGRTAGWKRAVVTLAADSHIDLT